jgi:hypothetical protein
MVELGFSAEQNMDNEQEMRDEQRQLQHQTELVPNLRADEQLDVSKHERLSSLVDLIADEAQENKTSVIAVGGKPLSGKTGVLQHFALDVVHRITGREWIDLSKQPEIGENGKRVEVYFITWSDCIKAAVKMDLLTLQKYGSWSIDQLKLITQVLNRAVQVASDNLPSALPNSQPDSIKLLFVDAPFITGAEYDRGFTCLLNRMKLAETRERTYFIGVEMTDVHSQEKRLRGREKYRDIQESQDQLVSMKEWQEEFGVQLEEEESVLKEIASYLYLSAGSPYTAAVITIHANKLILKLHEQKKITLTERIIRYLKEEILLLEEDYNLANPEVVKRQNLTLSIVCRQLFRYLVEDVGLDKSRVFVGENADLPEVNAYFLLQLHHSLIPQILEAEEKRMADSGAKGVYSKIVPPMSLGNNFTL